MEKNYPAPKKNKIFKHYWETLLPKVIERENFHISHLKQLEVLCDLYIDYHNFSKYLEENGYTYESDGRYGVVRREHPEIKLKQKSVSEIRQLSKALGIVLAKDTSSNRDEEGDEWS